MFTLQLPCLWQRFLLQELGASLSYTSQESCPTAPVDSLPLIGLLQQHQQGWSPVEIAPFWIAQYRYERPHQFEGDAKMRSLNATSSIICCSKHDDVVEGVGRVYVHPLVLHCISRKSATLTGIRHCEYIAVTSSGRSGLPFFNLL